MSCVSRCAVTETSYHKCTPMDDRIGFMTPKGAYFFCFVLCMGRRIQAQRFSRLPVLSAVPSSVVPRNETVKLLCRGTPESYLYHLEVLRRSDYELVERRLGFNHVVEFSMHPVEADAAGRYSCRYRKSDGWSQHSEPLDLVVTGFYEKPTLSTDQSLGTVVGDNISFYCGSASVPFDSFSLTKDGNPDPPQHQNGRHSGHFTLGPVTSSFSGNYSCYGWYKASPYLWSSPSDTLQLLFPDPTHKDHTTENSIRMSVAALVFVILLVIMVDFWHSQTVLHKTDRQDVAEASWTLCLSHVINSQHRESFFRRCVGFRPHTLLKPLIWATPKPIIPRGKQVTIWCQGAREAVKYHLLFKGQIWALMNPKAPGSMSRVRFSIPAMTLQTAGSYSCVYLSGELWSESSEPLDLVVTGMYDTPTLSMQPRPEVGPGENVTFQCRLEKATSTFFLLKEGSSNRPQKRYGSQGADFPLGPLTPAHRGAYRCYGSYNDFVWSFPSEPVRLLHTEEYPWDLDSSATETGFQNEFTSWDHRAQNLFRIGVTVLIMVAIIGLLAGEWLGRKRPQEEVIKAPSHGPRRRVRTRRPFNT
ncbi:PREDICTED: leukocyte immunoglobulin-like receptor subfamily B member 3-like [Elephantulus edwardii]|uniref:leukocyte immunoglobulin-like receptor subfamily B member 3-like n=1 Tax=Elephantulus edwardii TaxID=28737 RepID=UPI0003F0753C|nr:PREDICTED: leukocyte immunoglobulin-like receptor subfamily B member 3-like [Elephantulus edwardii]